MEASTLTVSLSFVVTPHLSVGIIFTHISFTNGEKVLGISKSLFLAINAKGGESIKPKAKGPHHHHFKIFKIKDLVGIHKGFVFPIGIY
jgi:hypothetical protein